MKVVSINIRGLGSRLKKDKIRNLIREEKADFIAIHESKLVEVDSGLVRSLWGDQDVEWPFTSAEGNSGGIISMWSGSQFKQIFTFSGKGFLGVSGVWVKNNKCCNIINIYSPCLISEKRELWRIHIMSKRGFDGVLWCLVGDFNAIKNRSERRGTSLISQDSYNVEFQSFIDELDLIDLPVLGKKFTWFRPDGSAMSRLDRFLVTEEWANLWSLSA